jgi:hypothetical protein
VATATIQHFPQLKTFSYAELWSAQLFGIRSNDWWPSQRLNAEPKGDERGIGCKFKLDIPSNVGAVWVVWEGTTAGVALLHVVKAADEKQLDETGPGGSFLPVRHGVNVLVFDGQTPPPEPEPEPSEPEPIPTPQPEPEEPVPTPAPPSPGTVSLYSFSPRPEVDKLTVVVWGNPPRDVVYILPSEEFARLHPGKEMQVLLDWVEQQIVAGNYDVERRERG